MEIFLGIDWSHTHHDACWLNERGQVLSRLTIPHTPEGLIQLDVACQQLGVSRSECGIGLETAHTLLIDFLWEQGYSQVFVIPPGAIKGARRRYRQTNAHTDQSDAWVIADVLRTDPATLYPWRPDGVIVRQLRAKVSLLHFLTQEIRRLSNRLRAVLARYYPATLHVFHDPASLISLLFLQAFPTPHAAAALTRQAFGEFARAHRYRQSDPVLSAAYARLQAAYPIASATTVVAYEEEAVWLAQHLLAAQGVCHSSTQQTSYAPWRQILRALVAADHESPVDWNAAQELAQLEQSVAELNRRWLDRLPLLSELLGLAIPDTTTTRALEAPQRQAMLFNFVLDLLGAWANRPNPPTQSSLASSRLRVARAGSRSFNTR